jgi:dipeptidyl aminopeptidase/acylaminoacyl peptidase
MPRAARSRLTTDDLVHLRLPGQPRISPDGRWVVFTEKTHDLRLNRSIEGLRLVEVASGSVRTWTSGSHSDTAPSWMPDSRGIVFVSDRGGSDALWRIGLQDGEPERLTKLTGRVRSPQVSPDGRSVAFLHAPLSAQAARVARSQRTDGASAPAAGPEFRHLTRLGYKHDGGGFHDGAWMHVWLCDLRTRRVRQLTQGAWDDGQIAWSPDSRRLAFVSNRIARADVHFMNADLFVVSARGGRARQVTRQRGPKSSPSWSPDGRRIAYIGHASYPDTIENAHVWVVPAGKGAARDLMPDADLMCDDLLLADTKDFVEGSAPVPVWSADGRRIFFIATVEGAANVWEIELRGGKPRQRTFGAHEISALSQSADGKRWAFVRITATSPGDVWLAEAGDAGKARRSEIVPGARARRLTRLNGVLLARHRPIEPTELRIPCVGGHEIQGWLLRAATPGRGPAVLMVHGGPYAAYGWSFFHELQTVAAAGYHVFYANPRGSIGYGRAFMRGLVGRWGHVDSEDIARIADAIESMPFVDPSRIAIAGGSYGGYLTNWVISHTRRFKCAISMRGVSNLISMFGTSDIGWDLINEFEEQTPWASLDRWWRISPLAHVHNIRTPLLLMHSDEDHRCPVGQAEEMFTALRILDRDVEMVRFLGESHGLSRSGRPHNRLERLRRIVDWFDRKL